MSVEYPDKFIHFDSQINQSSIQDLVLELSNPYAPRSVFINSPGGRIDFFDELGPAIESQFITTVAGNVASAANILYLLGHERIAFPDATFFFHEAHAFVGPFGGISIAQLDEIDDYANQIAGKQPEVYEKWAEEMRASQTWFLRFMHTRTGVPSGILLNLMRNNVELNAYEAREYGIVHHIIDPWH